MGSTWEEQPCSGWGAAEESLGRWNAQRSLELAKQTAMKEWKHPGSCWGSQIHVIAREHGTLKW